MSLYNLIPSCPVCNQKKSKTNVPLSLHPYEVNLSDMLKFKVKNENAYINPKYSNNDLLQVEISTGGNADLRTLVNDLALEKRYSRHLDIVEELEYALYLDRYYSHNFLGFTDDLKDFMKIDSKERIENCIKRHVKGFYENPDAINQRPLTKFCQDIYEQLAELHNLY